MASRTLCLHSPLLNPRRSPTPLARRPTWDLGHQQVSAWAAVRCAGVARVSTPPTLRRSANYRPSLWQDSFIQTLTSDYTGEAYETNLEELKGRVRSLIGETAGAAAQLELLDLLRRLGVDYHFEHEIKLVLHALSANMEDVRVELDGDLLHTALLFRLFREHGLEVSQDIFDGFIDEQGEIKGYLRDDAEGILGLYEATFLAYQGETLEEARRSATSSLTQLLLNKDMKAKLREQVEKALEMPLHWWPPRLYARWFIDMCDREEKLSPLLVELAKMDFDMVQSKHREDVRVISRWWKDLGLERLSFARNRIMECFLWASGVSPLRQFHCCRRGLTKINQLITTIDDVYDVYGSIDELEAFTTVIERWDIEAAEELPNYMKVCVHGLFQTTTELARQCFERSGFNCLSHLKKSWIDLCKCYLVEARWYHGKHTPTLDEYMANAWISISGPVILVHAYFLLSENITKEALDYIEEYQGIIERSSSILRLNDDLGTSVAELERGDILKSVECHMHERNAPEAMARESIKALVSNTWKKMNEECSLNEHLPKSFVNAAINLARMSHFFYQHGDGFGAPDKETENLASLMLIEPIHERGKD